MRLFLSIALLGLFTSLSAQEVLVRSNGDSIVLFEDGTWKTQVEEVKIAANISLIGDIEATRTEDAMTGVVSIVTTRWGSFAKNNINGFLSGDLLYMNDLLILRVSITSDLGCLSEYSSKILVKLSDNSIIEFSQLSDTDCGDSASANFIPLTRDEMKTDNIELITELTKERMDDLLKYEWKMIRVHGSKYYSDYFPNEGKRMVAPQEFFMQHLSALMRKM